MFLPVRPRYYYSAVVILLLPIIGFSQEYIGKTRASLKKELQKKAKKNRQLVLHENDSTLSLTISNPDLKKVSTTFYFNKTDICRSEKIKSDCQSCLEERLQSILLLKKYGWKKINENQYVSEYDNFLMLEIPPDKQDLSFVIFRTEWTKALYKLLTGQ